MSITPHSSPTPLESWEVLDLLTSLVQKSLVIYEEDEQGKGRYHLLEPMRQYARDRLLADGGSEERAGGGEAAAVRERHRDRFLALAEQADQELAGGHRGEWLDWLEREHDNLRAALEWTAAQGQGEVGVRLGGAVWWVWYLRVYRTEGREHLARLLALSGAEARTAARARALRGAGWLAHWQGDQGEASALLDESLAISRELGDKRGIAWSLRWLGEATRAQRDLGRARALLEESLPISRELGDRSAIMWSLPWLGVVARLQEDYGAARTFWEEDRAIQKELGNKGGIAHSLIGLGQVVRARGDHEEAWALFEEGEATARSIADPRDRHNPLADLGHLARELGDYGRAAALYRESLALRREFNYTVAIARSLEDFAVLAARQGQAERAARLLGAAEAQCEALEIAPPAADRADYERALGGAAFAAAWAAGWAMTLDQAISYALGEKRGPTPSTEHKSAPVNSFNLASLLREQGHLAVR